MPTSSLIFDYDYSDILSPYHNPFNANSSNSFSRLKTWKYDEWLSYPTATRDNNLASTEKFNTYYIMSPNGGEKVEVLVTPYLSAPFLGGTHLGVDSGIYNGFPNNATYGANMPLVYMNQLILDMQSKYLEMDSDIRLNSYNSMLNYYSTYADWLNGDAPSDLYTTSTIPSPTIPVSLSMKMLDLYDYTNSAYQYNSSFLHLESGTPMPSGAGPIYYKLRRINSPISFVKNMAINGKFKAENLNRLISRTDPTLIAGTAYPGSPDYRYIGYSDNGVFQWAHLDFGTSYPKSIDIDFTTEVTSYLPIYYIYERDSGNFKYANYGLQPYINVDFGHEHVVGQINFSGIYTSALTCDGSGVSIDSNGAFVGNSLAGTTDNSFFNGYINGVTTRNLSIDLNTQIRRNSLGNPIDITWHEFFDRQFNNNNPIFNFRFITGFDVYNSNMTYKSIYTALITRYASSPTTRLTTDTDLSINGLSIPFANLSLENFSGYQGGGFTQSVGTEEYICDIFLSGTVNHQLAAIYSAAVNAAPIYVSSPAPTGYTHFIKYDYEVKYSIPTIGIFCKDINSQKIYCYGPSGVSVPSTNDYEGFTPFLYGGQISPSNDNISDFSILAANNIITFSGYPFTYGNASPYPTVTGIPIFTQNYTSEFVTQSLLQTTNFMGIQNLGYVAFKGCLYGGYGAFQFAPGYPINQEVFDDGGSILEINNVTSNSIGLTIHEVSGVRYKHKSLLENNTTCNITSLNLVLDVVKTGGVGAGSARVIVPIPITTPTSFNTTNLPQVSEELNLNPNAVLGAWWL